MAFNATGGGSGFFHYLVDISLASTTLRYADEDLSIKLGTLTGAFYGGRLPRSGTIVRDLGTFLEAREQVNSFAINLDNRDQALSTLFWNATFANKPVHVWLGEGDSISDYSQIFVGNIEFPGGVEFDDQIVTVSIVDKRLRDRRILPLSTEKYTTQRYPNVEARYKTEPIPIVYGDWSSAAASGVSLPCACVNTLTQQFKVAGHGLKSIDRYLKNAAVLGPANIKNVSLSAATFELSAVAYDATSDVISVNCQGQYTANGSLIESPSYTLRHVLTAYQGLTGADLNGTAFNTLEGHTATFKLRRFIDTESQSDTLIQEMLNECQVDLRFVDGKYSPKYRFLDSGEQRMNVFAEDIVLADDRQEVGDFAVRFDPDRMYVNKIPAKYQYDPIDAKYLSATTQSSTLAILRDGGTVERAMDFNWMYDKTQVESRVARELFLFSKQPAHIEARFAKRVLMEDLADQLDITYSVFSGATFQIRRIETDLGQMTARVSAYNIFTDVWGVFCTAGATTWESATDDQRRDQGFWCNASGLALPGDSNSDWSKWY